MRALTEMLALDLVEEGAGLTPLDRAVLLVAQLDAIAPDEAAGLAIDERDARLIDAYIQAFGSKIGFFARCPDCGAGHEAQFDLKTLPPPNPKTEVRRKIGGQVIKLRAPTSLDLARAAAVDEPGLLLQACGAPPPKDSGARFAEEVERRIAEAFPLLNVMFEFRCDDCGKPFSSRFDIAEWLWREMNEVARSAVEAVDRLARAYGWSEAEILSMSPARRAMYLAQVAA